MAIVLHERHLPMSRAHNEIDAAMCDVIKKYELTGVEVMGILASLMQSWAKWMLKEERN